ncbi:3'-5' exoribonuclease YhaM family protein [Candidatus Clostridium radicumherbarum]|uniref:3'-5' exoribonuclease YhaM family protein n=1 Tax=Candidatus Clostridium radicumherbarum TaxID=3381662 RepID=A0ABW8TN79_9CLOT
MEFKKINEINAGEKIEGFFLLKSIDLKTSSNNKKYLDLNLCDKTGEMNAKLWEYEEGDETKFSSSSLVKVRGSVSLWNNTLQLKIEKMRESNNQDNVNLEDFVPVAPLQADFMYDEILKYANNMTNISIKNIVIAILQEKQSKLMHYPAAKKNHHAIKSGLLFHVLTMLHAGEKLCEIYSFLNRDLLYAGIMLHDIAKLEEMEANELGIVSEYTVEGQLLGHITQGIKKIELVAEAVGADKESTMLLQHMILSHHYEPEYGSPVKPMFPEAELLHHLDIIDARMYDMKRVTGEVEAGSFSEKVYSLDNRKIYKPSI